MISDFLQNGKVRGGWSGDWTVNARLGTKKAAAKPFQSRQKLSACQPLAIVFNSLRCSVQSALCLRIRFSILCKSQQLLRTAIVGRPTTRIGATLPFIAAHLQGKDLSVGTIIFYHDCHQDLAD